MKVFAAFLPVLLLSVSSLQAQGPPPLQPLNPPPAPAGNPVTAAKANLGKTLFWDEQLSSTRTVSCGTCHAPAAGGSDPRSSSETIHPGPDGIAGNADDIFGSPGVILNHADGTYELEDFFGMAAQVTGRYAPSAINAGYSNSLFWDGRAGNTFNDPVSGAVILPAGAALESQAAGPPISGGEMAHQDRDWIQIAARIESAVPLTLSPSVPADLDTWINNRDYPTLFSEAFGSAEVSPAKIIMAIATYERGLVSNQAPIDALIAGNQNALTQQEQQGMQLFGQLRCAVCHRGNRFTDDRFHYIGVRPGAEDPGRFAVTGNNADLGRMKTPTLRNVALRGEFMHNGRFSTLAEVVDFYDRGGDFDAPNKDNDVRPLNLTQVQKNALIAFLGRPLTDPRVEESSGVFSHPELYAGSAFQPGVGTDLIDDESGNTPQIVAIEPALSGTPSFTTGLYGIGAAQSVSLVVDKAPILSGAGIPDAESVMMMFDLTTASDGSISQSIPIPGGNSLGGTSLYGKWFVDGNEIIGESASFQTSVFGDNVGNLSAPTQVIASSNGGSGVVNLNWSAVADATSYEVYRANSASFSEARRLDSISAEAYSDTTVSGDSVYHYWIVSVNEHEASAPSVSASGSTFDLNGFTLNATDLTSATETTLNWTAQSGADSYTVYRGLSASPAELTLLGESGSATNYSDLSGMAARTYYYRVVALDDAGDFLTNSIVATGGRALASPQNVTGSVGTFQDHISLGWDTVSEAVGFRVLRSSNSEAESEIGISPVNSYDDFSAAAGRDYSYRVVAYNDYGSSVASQGTIGYRAVSAPSGVSATINQHVNSIVVAWTSAEGVNEYAIFRSISEDFADAVELGLSSGDSYLDDSAVPGTSYYYWVASIDEANERILGIDNYTEGMAGELTPDLKIGKTLSSLRGNNIYNTSAAGQTFLRNSRRFRTIKSLVCVENDGNVSDIMKLAGSRGSRKFKVSYFRIAPTATNMTGSIRAGVAQTELIASGGAETILIKIKPVKSKLGNRNRSYRYNVILRANSTVDTTQSDCAKTRATTRF